jgi:hypothetical protein
MIFLVQGERGQVTFAAAKQVRMVFEFRQPSVPLQFRCFLIGQMGF